MAETSFESLMKEIGNAIKLDNDSKDQEAYKKYVICIYKIATNLVLALNNADGNVIVDRKISQQVKLVGQCADRVSVLIEKIDKSKMKLNSKSSCDSPRPFIKEPPLATLQSTEHVSNPIHLNSLVPPLPPENNPYIFRIQKTPVMSPMEIAMKQNQSLMAAYKARMKRLNHADFNAFSYSLTIQRKLAENIAIARAQEEELARKMQARNQRLEAEAAKRFATPIGMSKEEQEQRQIYKRILMYENDATWLKNWRNKMEANPEDPILISQLVADVLRCADHPLTELLKKYQVKIFERLYPLVNNKHDELDRIKVPLSKNAWPTLDEVSDVVYIRSLCSPQSPTVSQGKKSFKEPIQDTVSSKKENDSVNNTRTEPPETIPLSGQSDDSSDEGGVVELDKSSSLDSDKAVNSVSEDDVDRTCHTVTVEFSDEKGNVSIDMSSSNDGELLKPVGGLENAISETKRNLNLAVSKGQELFSQVSWERKQAQLLMRQVTRDYSSYKLDYYDDDNLDYLFDEEDDDESNSFLTPEFWNSLTSGKDCRHGISESDSQIENSPLARSVSHQPTGSSIYAEDPGQTCYSLPAKLDEHDGVDDKTFSKMHLEACGRHLQSISEDVHRYLEKLLVMMTIAYEPLDTPVGRDQCAVSLEEPFFKPIWKTLLKLFRVVNYKQELVLASIMTKYANITPEEMKVSKKFCLVDSAAVTQPYQAVITELSHVQEYYTMLTKLECVVKVCRMICECVDDHYKKIQEREAVKKNTPSVGADDLLPILSYVIIKSGLPQLAAECQAMTEFIHEGYMMGEEGYCLTTLRTALNFVTSLYPTCLTSKV
ncbi:hypothetical protein Btru_031098 [Bulinus truncatus]|nr:hypothetical protein Btru_031098 [Bulinus truncatus]